MYKQNLTFFFDALFNKVRYFCQGTGTTLEIIHLSLKYRQKIYIV